MTSETSIWSSPPPSLSLPEGEVHVWRLTLDRPIEKFLDLLQPAEQARANRFHFEKDRKKFVIGRAFLRLLLGRYLQTDPKQLPFAYGEYGKPTVGGEFSESRLRFNMSNSRDIALFGFTEGRELGIDVEYMRADFASDNLAQRFFSPFEIEALRQLPGDDRVDGFFRCWTRKEAYIKATGRGLYQPLDEFDVTLGAGDNAELLRNEDGSHARWKLVDVAVGLGYAGAIAVEKPVYKIRYWDVDDRD